MAFVTTEKQRKKLLKAQADQLARAVIKKTGLKKEKGTGVIFGIIGMHQALVRAYKNTQISMADFMTFCNTPPFGNLLVQECELDGFKDFREFFEAEMKKFPSTRLRVR